MFILILILIQLRWIKITVLKLVTFLTVNLHPVVFLVLSKWNELIDTTWVNEFKHGSCNCSMPVAIAFPYWCRPIFWIDRSADCLLPGDTRRGDTNLWLSSGGSLQLHQNLAGKVWSSWSLRSSFFMQNYQYIWRSDKEKLLRLH